MRGEGLTIGQVAARAGVGAKAIRFYERVGVLPTARRAANRYRVYASDVVDVVRFIKQAQGLGLTLDEIREIVSIRQGGRPPCQHVHRLLQEKAAELDRKLEDLLLLRRRIPGALALGAGKGAARRPYARTSSRPPRLARDSRSRVSQDGTGEGVREETRGCIRSSFA